MKSPRFNMEVDGSCSGLHFPERIAAAAMPSGTVTSSKQVIHVSMKEMEGLFFNINIVTERDHRGNAAAAINT